MSDGQSLLILIDFDNLNLRSSLQTLHGITRSVIAELPPNFKMCSRSDVRIYGGWYESNEMTQRAQELSIQIQNEFPLILKSVASGHNSIVVDAELATSLMAEPGRVLVSTLKLKSPISNMKIKPHSELGCSHDPEACMLNVVRNVLTTNECPTKDICGVSHCDVVHRTEQKQVDTMMACDILYAATRGYSGLVIVSNDDDFVPPLRIACIQGASVARAFPRKFRNANRPMFVHETLVEIELFNAN